ncbi:hypothetical protein [Paenibacillus polymyxa]|uniref:hypothetical protein n=1 Tax=Paenibacillus polymyxa TaxID=1406 RepID=UPI001780B6D4|nr:hypothetical protein [Paenibacillus polymyxa]QOH62384.1 hypothetical protein DI243_13760 [Paenibacillus polymyxa]
MKKVLFKILLSLSIGLTALSTSNAHAANLESINLVPKMTSNTSPSGEAFASSSIGGQAYMLFDRVNTSYDYDWATSDQLPAYVGYDFKENEVVTKYTLNPTDSDTYVNGIPKAWTFQGWDGTQWIDLDKQQDQINWKRGEIREFAIINSKSYSKYRLYITADNGRTGGYTCIGELQLFGYKEPITPNIPEMGNRAILTVTMITGLEKEFDLSMDEVNSFIAWYEGKQSGTGTASYAIDKHNNNKGPFSNRKDYVIFNKILTFEVSEYSTK